MEFNIEHAAQAYHWFMQGLDEDKQAIVRQYLDHLINLASSSKGHESLESLRRRLDHEHSRMQTREQLVASGIDKQTVIKEDPLDGIAYADKLKEIKGNLINGADGAACADWLWSILICLYYPAGHALPGNRKRAVA